MPKQPLSHSSIFDLSLDVKYIILDQLDNLSLANLSKTCIYFAMLVRNVLSFREAQVSMVDHFIAKKTPFLNYRAGVSIGSTFYMPFINDAPFCYTYNLTTNVWQTHKLDIQEQIQPQITCSTVIGRKIYLACGRLLHSYTLSNALIEIDTETFKTRFIKDADGIPPRPRHEHTVDAIGNRYLVVFGGLCYNSVGENDVFVYDALDNRWFIPPITGHLPHLRFGHASAVIGNCLYIHGGAQLDNDSSYIVYDDLYKLDCDTWTWYKYEHPEVERYLRTQSSAPRESPPRNHLISTNGDSPYDRFQSYMASYGSKLIIFGGHSIREDAFDNEILLSYPLDELCIFNTKRCHWSILRASTKYNIAGSGEGEEDDFITVSDMSVASVPSANGGIRFYIIAGQKALQVPRTQQRAERLSVSSKRSTSSSNGSQNDPPTALPSIDEIYDNTRQEVHDDDDDEEVTQDTNGAQARESETVGPENGSFSKQVKELFRAIDPDLEHSDVDGEERNLGQEAHILERYSKSNTTPTKPSSSISNRSSTDLRSRHTKRRRPSISVIHHKQSDDSYDKMNSSSSHSSYSSSAGSDSLGRKLQRAVTPCAIILELLE